MITEEFKEYKADLAKELKEHKEAMSEQLRDLKETMKEETSGIKSNVTNLIIVVSVIFVLSKMPFSKIWNLCCTRKAKPTTEQVSEEERKKLVRASDRDEHAQPC